MNALLYNGIMFDNDVPSLVLAAALAFAAIGFVQMMFHRAFLGRRGFFDIRPR